jgi:hypothetical protein
MLGWLSEKVSGGLMPRLDVYLKYFMNGAIGYPGHLVLYSACVDQSLHYILVFPSEQKQVSSLRCFLNVTDC